VPGPPYRWADGSHGVNSSAILPRKWRHRRRDAARLEKAALAASSNWLTLFSFNPDAMATSALLAEAVCRRMIDEVREELTSHVTEESADDRRFHLPPLSRRRAC